MSGYFVAGTDTGVGKTRVMTGLLEAMHQLGLGAMGMKPVAAGLIDTENGPINDDVLAIAAVTGQISSDRHLNSYSLPLPLSPHIAAERAGICIEIKHIVADYASLAADARMVLVEGAGGWLSPISADRTMADIAIALRLPVLLVVGLRLGCLNHAQLTAQAIRSSGLRLAGWVGSQPQAEFAAVEANLQTLSHRLGAEPLAVLPWLPERSGDAALLKPAAEWLARNAVAGVGAARESAPP